MVPTEDLIEPKEISDDGGPVQWLWSKGRGFLYRAKLQKKSIISLIILGLCILFLYYIFILQDEQVVEPFDTLGMGDKNLSGDAISALFSIDLNNIYETWSYNYNNYNNHYSSNTIKLVHPSTKLDHFEAGLGTLGVGGTSISIGNMFFFIDDILRHLLKNDKDISGILQRYGSMIRIEATMRGRTFFIEQEVNTTLNKGDQSVAENNIPLLLKELAFKIAYSDLTQLHPDLKKELPQTIPAFKNLTEGLMAIKEYQSTNDPRYLDESKNKLLLIRGIEPNYATEFYLQLLTFLGSYYPDSKLDSEKVFGNIRAIASLFALHRGYDYANNNDFSHALIRFYEASKLTPNCSMAWDDRGWALNSLGRYHEALKAFNVSINNSDRENGPDAIVWMDRGYAFEQIHNNKSALADYKNATKKSPFDSHSWYYNGSLLSNLTEYKDAIQDFNKAIDIDPQNAAFWNAESAALNESRDYNDSFLAAGMAIELDPNLSDAWYNEGNALNRLGRTTEATAALNKAKELGYTGQS